MKQVSEQAEEVLSQLVAWEMLGREDIDPKPLLRQVPLADLSIVLANIGQGGFPFDTSVSLRLVYLEHAYRTGKLEGDYELERKGSDVTLHIPLKEPVKFVRFNFLQENA
jgi:hypothetical protein